ncbi:hypothetical protein ABIE59_002046, partial [Marinobacter sp. MBR-99]|uniref:S-type pyocin domain-containing protein n=1 Tax=Marinobacter sp. MBR-99 TaxID=3156461 RepID=UPI003398EFB0
YSILVTPIQEDGQEHSPPGYQRPFEDQVELIVSFPKDSGIEPLYLVFQKASGSGGERVAKKINLTYPVETKPNTAFFWSGRTDGVGGESVARKIATENKGTTLEALIEERHIHMPTWDTGNPEVVQAWKAISADYAKGVSGTVRAVIGRNLRPGNVWETAELPALINNPNVDRIITIDPVTKVETEIFVRDKQ